MYYVLQNYFGPKVDYFLLAYKNERVCAQLFISFNLYTSQAHNIHAVYTAHIHDTRRAHKDVQIMLSAR